MLGFMDWVLAILAIVGGLYLYGTWTHDFFKKRNFPCFPSPRPFIGHVGSLLFRTSSMGDLLQRMYEETKGLKCFGFFAFRDPFFMVKDPEIIKMIMVKDFDYFVNRVVQIDETMDSLFGKGILNLRGHKWKDMRGILSPTFTSSKMKAMFVLVSKSGEQLANHLEKRCKDERNEQLELDMKDLFSRYANDVIATSAFGVICDSLDQPENEFYVTGKESTNFSGIQALKMLGYNTSPAMMKLLGIPFMSKKSNDFFSSLVVDTMRVREKEGIIRPDMIHLLMQAKKGTLSHEGMDDTQKASKKVGTELTDEDITAQAFLFFLAGFETTSTHLGFLSNLLATHPDVQRRVQEEIDASLETDGGALTYEGLQNMKYLDMCVSEALRLWPPLLVSNRECVKPYVFQATDKTPSIKMKKGDSIWIPVIGIHRDPEYFPEPDRFDPERFSDENKHNIQPFTYMPFGIGPRNCVAMRFALMEVKIAIIHLLSRFNLEVSPKTPLKMKFKKTMNVNVEGGFWLGISPRN